MSGEKLSTRSEYIIAATALVLSLSTLGVYIYQAKVMKEQQHVSVWPYMEWYTGNVEDYHIAAKNKGVGPAIIRKVELTVDGKPVQNNQELISAVLGNDWKMGYVNSTLKGRVLSPGEEVAMLRIPDVKEGRAFEEKLRQHKFRMSITYCSVYGDCWVTTEDEKVRRLPKVDLGLY
jgi:hypothetical protein